MSNAVLVERKEAVAWITINRPEVRNALDVQTTVELEHELARLAADSSIRCLVIRGAGDRVFVSGADVREFRDKLTTPDGARATDAAIERMQARIRDMPMPVIAQVQGHAIGGGCVLAVACDFRVASMKGRFGIPIAKFGFMLSVIDTVRLAELVGLGQARRLLMKGEVIDAAEAFRIGLVDQLVEPEDLEQATAALAATLAANAPFSLKATKQILENFYSRKLSIDDGDPWYQQVYASHDLQEGLNAFFERRKPVFEGR